MSPGGANRALLLLRSKETVARNFLATLSIEDLLLLKWIQEYKNLHLSTWWSVAGGRWSAVGHRPPATDYRLQTPFF
jgi:hypothetical protein